MKVGRRPDSPWQRNVEMSMTTDDVKRLVEQIGPLLAGLKPELIGAALTELLAIWLAGHVVRGDSDATRKLRAELLAKHCFVIRQMTEIYAKRLGTAEE